MEAREVRTIACYRCGTLLKVEDNYCRHCGAPTVYGGQVEPRAGVAPLPASAVRERHKATDNPWFVLAMLFLALGPLALPMLWRSRGFSLLWKAVLTAIVVGVTVILVVALWYIVAQSLESVAQALR